MPSNFTKQPQYIDTKYLNSGTGDTTIGGTITTVPATGVANSGQQSLPGDRIVFGASDALAYSNTSVGTLYGGIYQYVTLLSTAAAGVLARLAFWDPTSFSVAASTAPPPDNLYRITGTELQSGVGPTSPVAGVFINALAAGSSWWVQIAGKATMAFGPLASSQYGTASSYAINLGVFAGGYGTTTGSGLVTQINGDTFETTSAQIAALVNGYLGTAEVAPTASANSIVDMHPRLFRF